MSEPFIQEFEMPDGRVIASVVLDQGEFDAVLDELARVGLTGLTQEGAEQVKVVGNVPLLARGTKTEFVFERFGVAGRLISMIVRGRGRDIADRLMASVRAEAEMN
jgi:hypothetical protein